MAPGSGRCQDEGECRGVVSVLYYDGNVLEFPQRIKCSELLASFPSHAVCPANALLLKQEGKVLPGDFFLELGQMYFLVPKQGDAVLSGSGENVAQFPVRFKIARDYLARILEEGGFGVCPSEAAGFSSVEEETPAEELGCDESWCLDRDGGVPPGCNKQEGQSSGTRCVTLLHHDGKVQEYEERIKCSEVLASLPFHAVCPATALVSKQQGKMLTRDSFLEPGRTYFLVPRSRNVPCARSEDSSPRSSMRFKISKDYLARILEEAGVSSISDVRAVSARTVPSTIRPFREQKRQSARQTSKASRVSPLASIPEVVPA